MSEIIVRLVSSEEEVTIRQRETDDGLFVARVEGWRGTPEPKVDVTERQTSDGAFPTDDESITYAARVVTVYIVAFGSSDQSLARLIDSVNAMSHKNVTLEITDNGVTTRTTGYVSTVWDDMMHGNRCSGSVTVVCHNPRRYGTERVFSIVPSGSAGGGLMYSEDEYIVLPIAFSGDAPSDNATTVSNEGTARAFPIITVEGDLPSGVVISHSGGQLAYAAPLGMGAPLVLDSLTRTASVLGVDVTRSLTRRDFPVVEPNGSTTISALADGNGTISITVSDTYL